MRNTLAAWFGAAALTSVSASAFMPVKGTYNGLFAEPEGVWQQSAGIIRLNMTPEGKHSGVIYLGPYRYSFSGWFDADGYWEQWVSGRDYYSVRLAMQVDAEDPELIYGTVSTSEWTADLIMDRAVYDGKTSICPDEGKYTMLIPGSVGSSDQPGGNSYGTVTVDRAGRVRFAGSMADGWKLSQSATIAKNGEWPFYASLYSGGGVIWSWMFFNPSADEELVGDVTWIKPVLWRDVYYREGFAIQVYSWGSRYVQPPKGSPILDLPEAAVELNGGDLYENLLNRISIDDKSKVMNLGPVEFSMKFTLSNGLFKGKFRDPATSNMLSFSGVVLQSYNTASGYFRGFDETGEVWIEAW